MELNKKTGATEYRCILYAITSHHLYNTIRDLCNIAISHRSHDEMIEYESTNIWEFLRVKAFI